MLVLAVKDDGKVHIGEDIVIVASKRGNDIKLMIDAPKELLVLREELKDKQER